MTGLIVCDCDSAPRLRFWSTQTLPEKTMQYTPTSS
jgi:hypothetical protein